MPYLLHVAGGEFELPNAQAALELGRQVQAVQQAGIAGRIYVPLKEPGRVVYVYVSPGAAVAISGGDAPEFTTPPQDDGEAEIVIL